jgi:hypothetical protein
MRPSRRLSLCWISQFKTCNKAYAYFIDRGLSVLGNKSELSVEMNKRKLRQQQRDEDERRRQTRSLFDQRMEEQAKKIAMVLRSSRILCWTTSVLPM